MLKLRFIVVDRTKVPFLAEGENFFKKRLSRYARLEWIESKPVKIKKGETDNRILTLEGELIVKRFLAKDYIIALDRSGKDYDSIELANHINKLTFLHSQLTFVIGGPLGLSKAILTNAHEKLSLSKFTLTHEMSRLFLLEQLYRAFTILNGEKYHK